MFLELSVSILSAFPSYEQYLQIRWWSRLLFIVQSGTDCPQWTPGKMKCVIPEISYHNRDPVLSVDFQVGLITTRIISSLTSITVLRTLLTASPSWPADQVGNRRFRHPRRDLGSEEGWGGGWQGRPLLPLRSDQVALFISKHEFLVQVPDLDGHKTII